MVTQDLSCLKTVNIGHEIPKYDRTGFVRTLANNLSVEQALSKLLWHPKIFYSFDKMSALESAHTLTPVVKKSDLPEIQNHILPVRTKLYSL
jgi:hypothetical protein